MEVHHWHPFFVHFTISLLGVGAAFLFISNYLGTAQWRLLLRNAGLLNLGLGVFITIATVISGWAAFYSVDTNPESYAAMKDHMTWAMLTLIAFFAGVLYGIYRYAMGQHSFSIHLSPFLIILCLILAVTAYKGSRLVFHFGLGVYH